MQTHPTQSLCWWKKGSRFLLSGKGGILMTRLVGISPKRIHSGMHRGTQWVCEPCLSSMGQWAARSWMEQAGSVREPNPHAGQPKALGLGPPVNYAVSGLICYVPGWQEATGACGHTVTQRVRQGGGSSLYMACECDTQTGPWFVPVVMEKDRGGV